MAHDRAFIIIRAAFPPLHDAPAAGRTGRARRSRRSAFIRIRRPCREASRRARIRGGVGADLTPQCLSAGCRVGHCVAAPRCLCRRASASRHGVLCCGLLHSADDGASRRSDLRGARARACVCLHPHRAAAGTAAHVRSLRVSRKPLLEKIAPLPDECAPSRGLGRATAEPSLPPSSPPPPPLRPGCRAGRPARWLPPRLVLRKNVGRPTGSGPARRRRAVSEGDRGVFQDPRQSGEERDLVNMPPLNISEWLQLFFLCISHFRCHGAVANFPCVSLQHELKI